jgi:hypothetical protein
VRWLDLAMTLLFAFAIAVQYNDPDSLVWMVMYTPPTLLSWLAFRGRFRLEVSVLAFGAYVLLALYWSPALLQAGPESLTSWKMGTAADEEVREASGIVLCALWTGVLAWRARKAAEA